MKKKTISLGSLAACISVLVLFIFGASQPTLAAGKKYEALTKKVFPSVVKVEARNGWRKVATGVVIEKGGYIVTTALVSPRDAKLCVVTSEGEELDAEFLGMDPETHLALVRAKEGRLKPIELGKPEDVSPGVEIAVVSFSPEEKAAITTGVVSSVGEESLRLNVMVIAGASGSPVVDLDGRMVGLVRGAYGGQAVIRVDGQELRRSMASRVEAPSSGLALAIPVDIVDKVSSEIKETGKVRRGWLGISMIVNEDDEVEIIQVEKDSPADKAGLEEGDVVQEIEGQELKSREMLIKEIRKRGPGDEVTLQVERDGEEKDIDVELGEYSERDIWEEFEYKFPELFRVEPGTLPQVFRTAPDRSGIFTYVYGSRKYIGVDLQALNPELADYFGVEKGAGLLIAKVTKDGPAAKAGLKVGDVIVRADEKDMPSPDKLQRLIQGKEIGDKIKLEVIRNKKKMTLEVEVGEDESRGRRFIPEVPEAWDQAKALKTYTEAWKLNSEQLKKRQQAYAEAWKNYDKKLKSQYQKWVDDIQKQNYERKMQYQDAVKKYQDALNLYQKQYQENSRKYLNQTYARYRCIKV
jgi:S1-C subfamily serine protease